MFRRRGVTLTKALLTAVCMLAAPLTQAISVGNLTFSLPSETDFVSKRVVNNNKSARIYRIAISAIDSPGSSELRTRPVDGELLLPPANWRCRLVRASILNFTIMVHGITASATTGSHFAKSPLVTRQDVAQPAARSARSRWW
ncbi:putative fimbrial protein [Escherichia coli]|nr:putative fimbrial protein [Escherichia coli]